MQRAVNLRNPSKSTKSKAGFFKTEFKYREWKETRTEYITDGRRKKDGKKGKGKEKRRKVAKVREFH